jgi:hypothetical protein
MDIYVGIDRWSAQLAQYGNEQGRGHRQYCCTPRDIHAGSSRIE